MLNKSKISTRINLRGQFTKFNESYTTIQQIYNNTEILRLDQIRGYSLHLFVLKSMLLFLKIHDIFL